MNKIDQMYAETTDCSEFGQQYAQYLNTLLRALDFECIARLIQAFCEAREAGSRIFFIGNGGSAATASHFATDLAIGARLSEKPFKAISLTDNASAVSAVSNDDGYEFVFEKQLEVYLEPGDLLVAISASGNSQNLLGAVEYAKRRGNKTIGIIGFDGGDLRKLCDETIHIETGAGEYGPVEDMHLILNHLIVSYLHRWARDPERESGADKGIEDLLLTQPVEL